MNFTFIKIDDFKSPSIQARVSKPIVLFSHAGHISLTKAAFVALAPALLKDKRDIPYIHIAIDGSKLYIKVDTEPAHGLAVRFDGIKPDQSRTECSKITAQSSGLIRHLTQTLDWPLAKDKKKSIRYTLGTEVQPGIFELI